MTHLPRTVKDKVSACLLEGLQPLTQPVQVLLEVFDAVDEPCVTAEAVI